MNLPFTGIATFAKVPYAPDLATLDADVAIIGAPYDLGTQVRSGTRFGPRGIRNASTIYGMRTPRYYDAEFDEIYLDGVRSSTAATSTWCTATRAAASTTSRRRSARSSPAARCRSRSAATTPCRSRSCARTATPASSDICVVQIDAHLDFVDERLGVREGHGNVMRRIAEMPHTSGIAQIGIRGPGSSDPSDFEDARRTGSVIIGPRSFRELGVAGVLA